MREKKEELMMRLTISNTGLALIKRFEGCRLTAYQDAAGVWTIGYGHTSCVKAGQTISQAQADAYLKADCAAAEKAVNAYDTIYHWNQNQFDALVSFTFNVGSGNLKKLLQSGTRTITQISAMIAAYNKAGGKVLRGLVNRRAAEKELFDKTAATISASTSAPLIRIGHASIDENGKISGGAAGDQTGKEVCTRTWYSKPWDFVLRCKDSVKAEKMATACEKGCSNKNIGYDQKQRNTLNTQAQKVNYDLSKIATRCECDCSSFITVCALAAGIKITYGTNAPVTSTMKTAFTASGEFDILTAPEYLTSDRYLKRGDILVKAGSHTAMALQNGSMAAAASTTAYTHIDFVKEVQFVIGAKVDGIAGTETLSKTVTVSKTINNKHAVVKPIQKYLNSVGYPCGTIDGIAGAKFDMAVKMFQRANRCVADGEITAQANTWKKLLRLK